MLPLCSVSSMIEQLALTQKIQVWILYRAPPVVIADINSQWVVMPSQCHVTLLLIQYEKMQGVDNQEARSWRLDYH